MIIEIFHYTRAQSKRALPDALYAGDGEMKEELGEGWHWHGPPDGQPVGPFETYTKALDDAEKHDKDAFAADPAVADATKELYTLGDIEAPRYRVFLEMGKEGIIDFWHFEELGKELQTRFEERTTLHQISVIIVKLK